MKIVVDCNVLISAGMTDGTARHVLDHIITHHETVFSPATLGEYIEVIARPKFAAHQREMTRLLYAMLQVASIVQNTDSPIALPDPKDDMYLAAAIEAHAHMIVTGNLKHFIDADYSGVQIVNPRGYLDLYDI